jgi:hypothetical protein
MSRKSTFRQHVEKWFELRPAGEIDRSHGTIKKLQDIFAEMDEEEERRR